MAGDSAPPAEGTERRPLLGITHGLGSAPPMELARAAKGVCDLLWIVEGTGSEVTVLKRLLAKLGTVVDVTDLSPLAAAAVVGAYAPDGIATFYDGQLLASAKLADQLGLRFHSVEVARRLTDKIAQREAFQAAGVPVPVFWPVPHLEGAEIEAFAHSLGYPAVLKPRGGSGSRHTFPIEDASALTRVLKELVRDGHADLEMVVEEYLVGAPAAPGQYFADYVSVESVVSNGTISHVALNGRFPLAEPFRESGFFIPGELAADDHEAVLEAATRAIEAMGIEVGCLHTEVKLTPDGPRIIEVNGRIGGGVPEMLELASGVNLWETNFRLALGEHLVFEAPIRCGRVGYLFYHQAPVWAEEVSAIEGLGELADQPGVESVFLNRRPGDAVDWRDGNHGYVFSVTGSAADHAALVAIDRFIDENVHITYGGGRHE